MTEVSEPQADGPVHSPAAIAVTAARDASVEDERAQRDVAFSDVVRAHWAWECDFYAHQESDGELRGRFEKLLRKFERRFGELEEAYWSVRDASAVAVTVGKRSSRRHPFGEEIPRFHRATDWATRDEAAIAGALDDCESLAVKCEEVLRGASEKIALRRIYAVASHLLGYVDRARALPRTEGEVARRSSKEDVRSFVKRQRQELDKIELFYRRAGNKQARIVFFWGMVYGLLALLPVTVLAVTLIWVADGLDGGTGEHWRDLQLLMVSVAAGALGALLSVLSRMAALTGKFDLDHEVGRKQVRYLGFYRPFLGAIFGVATFLLFQSDLLQTNGVPKTVSYFGALAFLAGFFERFMKVAPGGVPTPIEEDAAIKEKRAEPQS